ncbi:hypothetical protein V8E53_005761 [Lactarius tabidus]
MGVIACYPNDPDAWVWSFNVQRSTTRTCRGIQCRISSLHLCHRHLRQFNTRTLPRRPDCLRPNHANKSQVDQVPSTSGDIEMHVVGPYCCQAQSPIKRFVRPKDPSACMHTPCDRPNSLLRARPGTPRLSYLLSLPLPVKDTLLPTLPPLSSPPPQHKSNWACDLLDVISVASSSGLPTATPAAQRSTHKSKKTDETALKPHAPEPPPRSVEQCPSTRDLQAAGKGKARQSE